MKNLRRVMAIVTCFIMIMVMMPTERFAEEMELGTPTEGIVTQASEPTVSVEPAAEATEEPVTEAAEEPTAEATEEPTAEVTEEPATEAAEEPTAEVTEELTTEATEESASEAVEEPTTEVTEEPTAEVTEEPATEAAEEPTVEVTEEPTAEEAEEMTTAEATEEPVTEATEEPIAEIADEPVAEITEEPTTEVIDEPTTESTDEVASEDKSVSQEQLPALSAVKLERDPEWGYDNRLRMLIIFYEDGTDEIELKWKHEEAIQYNIEVVSISGKHEEEVSRLFNEGYTLLDEEVQTLIADGQRTIRKSTDRKTVKLATDAHLNGWYVLYITAEAEDGRTSTYAQLFMLELKASETADNTQVEESEQSVESTDESTSEPTSVESTENPAEEPVEETTEATAEEPVEETAEATAEEPVEETTEVTAEEPVEETAEATAEEPVEETAEATAEEPAEETTEATAEEPVEETTEATVEEPVEETTEATVEEPVEETTEATAEETVEETTEEPVEESAEEIADESALIDETIAEEPTSTEEFINEQPDETIEENLALDNNDNTDTETMLSLMASAVMPEVKGVWYDEAIENKPLKIHVTTNLEAQYLYLYQGSNVLTSWSAEDAQIDVYSSVKEWHVEYTFTEPGMFYLWYRTSNDGYTMSEAFTAEPAQIKRPAIISVWYDECIEREPLKIHVTTNLDIEDLYLYQGDNVIASWKASELSAEQLSMYATCKEWHVEYTFEEPGSYYLWYKAADGNGKFGQPFTSEAVMVKRPAIISAWYDEGIENEPLRIHVTTNLDMEYLYLYQGDNVIASWKASELSAEQLSMYATCKEWHVEYTFTEPGSYYIWYRAADVNGSYGKPFSSEAVMIKRPAIISTWYDEGIENEPLKIHVTTNLDMTDLYLYQGDNVIASWNASELSAEQLSMYATCKEWHVEYTFTEPGTYYVWYKSADAEGNFGRPYSEGEPIVIGRPAIISVVYTEVGAANQETELQITTNLDMQHIYMYNGETELAHWTAEDSDITEYASCKDWTVTYTFPTAGEYYVWFKGSADGVEMSKAFSTESLVIGGGVREFEYTICDGEVSGVIVTKYNGNNANVVVPMTINGMAVIEIGDEAFMNNTTVTKITLPATIERIGIRAFAGCANLLEMD